MRHSLKISSESTNAESRNDRNSLKSTRQQNVKTDETNMSDNMDKVVRTSSSVNSSRKESQVPNGNIFSGSSFEDEIKRAVKTYEERKKTGKRRTPPVDASVIITSYPLVRECKSEVKPEADKAEKADAHGTNAIPVTQIDGIQLDTKGKSNSFVVKKIGNGSVSNKTKHDLLVQKGPISETSVDGKQDPTKISMDRSQNSLTEIASTVISTEHQVAESVQVESKDKIIANEYTGKDRSLKSIDEKAKFGSCMLNGNNVTENDCENQNIVSNSLLSQDGKSKLEENQTQQNADKKMKMSSSSLSVNEGPKLVRNSTISSLGEDITKLLEENRRIRNRLQNCLDTNGQSDDVVTENNKQCSFVNHSFKDDTDLELSSNEIPPQRKSKREKFLKYKSAESNMSHTKRKTQDNSSGFSDENRKLERPRRRKRKNYRPGVADRSKKARIQNRIPDFVVPSPDGSFRSYELSSCEEGASDIYVTNAELGRIHENPRNDSFVRDKHKKLSNKNVSHQINRLNSTAYEMASVLSTVNDPHDNSKPSTNTSYFHADNRSSSSTQFRVLSRYVPTFEPTWIFYVFTLILWTSIVRFIDGIENNGPNICTASELNRLWSCLGCLVFVVFLAEAYWKGKGVFQSLFSIVILFVFLLVSHLEPLSCYSNNRQVLSYIQAGLNLLFACCIFVHWLIKMRNRSRWTANNTKWIHTFDRHSPGFVSLKGEP